MKYDKYSGVTGGFRALLEDDFPTADFGQALGHGLNADGHLTPRVPGTEGFKGVCIVDRTKRRAGMVQDVMTHGEIVLDSDEDQFTPGASYYLDADGDLTTTQGRYYVGHAVESFRLVVRFNDKEA